jgi:phage gp45-like
MVTLADIRTLLAPLQRRLASLIQRATVTNIDDDAKCQTVQAEGLGGLLVDAVERLQAYGMTSHPFEGSEIVLLKTGSGVPLAVVLEDRRHRPAGTLAEGEVALYTDEGIAVLCKRGKIVELGPSPTDYVALADLVKEELSALCNTLNDLVYAYNTHTHVLSGTAGPYPLAGTAVATTSTTDPPALVGNVKATYTKAS